MEHISLASESILKSVKSVFMRVSLHLQILSLFKLRCLNVSLLSTESQTNVDY